MPPFTRRPHVASYEYQIPVPQDSEPGSCFKLPGLPFGLGQDHDGAYVNTFGVVTGA